MSSFSTVNPEMGEFFEGDMQLSRGDVRALFSKTGLVDRTKRWPKVLTTTTVPYVISPLYSELLWDLVLLTLMIN